MSERWRPLRGVCEGIEILRYFVRGIREFVDKIGVYVQNVMELREMKFSKMHSIVRVL